MATQKHIWAYLGIVVLVTWLANGIIPELQAGNIPIPATWAWLVRSLVPALVAITVLLPSVVSKPPGVPDVTTTTVTVTPANLMPTNTEIKSKPFSGADVAKAIRDALDAQARPPSALAPTVPPPAIPDPPPAPPSSG